MENNWYTTATRTTQGTTPHQLQITAIRGRIGQPTQSLPVGREPFDPANTLGSLQLKIFEMLKDDHDRISQNDRDWLVRIYNAYQGGRRVSRKMVDIVLRIWHGFQNTPAARPPQEFSKGLGIRKELDRATAAGVFEGLQQDAT
jgi:hypothetical protein